MHTNDTTDTIHIFAFCGPSASGKTELVARLLAEFPQQCVKWQQVTTRPRRHDNEDYLFLSRDEYDSVRGLLTCRTEFNGNGYGTMIDVSGHRPGTAVLTIVDSMGLADLIDTVRRHETGEDRRFGDHSVRVTPVLMWYELTEESMARRGRADRSVEFAQGELTRLLQDGPGGDPDFWRISIDTTNSWPVPSEFMRDVIVPTIAPDPRDETASAAAASEASGMEALEIAVTALLGAARYGVRDATRVVGELASLLEGMGAAGADTSELRVIPGPFMSDESLRRVAARIAVDVAKNCGSVPQLTYAPVLFGLQDAREQGFFTGSEVPAVEGMADFIPPQEPAAELESLAPVAEIVTKDAVDQAQRAAHDAVEQAQHSVQEALDNTGLAEEAAPPARFAPPAEVFAANDFEDWMLGVGAGIENFRDDTAFGVIVRQFLSANGGDPKDVAEVTSQSTKDGKGGQVTGFTAVVGRGRFFVEFNHRLRRPVSMQFVGG